MSTIAKKCNLPEITLAGQNGTWSPDETRARASRALSRPEMVRAIFDTRIMNFGKQTCETAIRGRDHKPLWFAHPDVAVARTWSRFRCRFPQTILRFAATKKSPDVVSEAGVVGSLLSQESLVADRI